MAGFENGSSWRHQAYTTEPKLMCRLPDLAKTLEFGNGNTREQHPMMEVSSTDPSSAECKKIVGIGPAGLGATRVGLEMCKLQIELGDCPRGFTSKDLPKLR